MSKEKTATEVQSDDKKVTQPSEKIVNFLSQSLFGSTPMIPEKKEEVIQSDEKPTEEAKDEQKEADDKGKEAAKEADPEKKEEPKKEDEGKEAAKKPKATKKVQPPVDNSASITEAVKETAKEVAKAVAKEFHDNSEAKKAEEEKLDIPEEYREEMEVAKYAEQADKKYAGTLDKMKAYIKSEDAYIKEWLKNNPGKKFDADDSEHDAFYSNNEKPLTEREVSRLLGRMDAEAIASEKAKEAEKKLQALETERAVEKLEPVIKQHVTGIATHVLKTVSGNKEATAESLAEADPILVDVGTEVARRFEPLISEAVKIFNAGGRYQVDTSNPVHKDVIDMTFDLEDSISALPKDQQVDDNGRMFATISDFAKLSKREQAKHWVVDSGLILSRIASIASHETSKLVDHKRKEIEKYTGKVTKKEAKEEKKEERQEVDKAKTQPATKSPPATVGDKIDTTKKVDQSKSLTVKEKLFQRMF